MCVYVPVLMPVRLSHSCVSTCVALLYVLMYDHESRLGTEPAPTSLLGTALSLIRTDGCLLVCLPLRHHFQGSCYLPSASWTLEQQKCRSTSTNTYMYTHYTINVHVRRDTFLFCNCLSSQPQCLLLSLNLCWFLKQTQMQTLSVWAAVAWPDLPLLTGLSHLQLDVAALQ